MRMLPWGVFFVCFATALSRPTENKKVDDENMGEWLPLGRDKSDWLSCHGLPCSEWDQVQRKATIINVLDADGPAAFLNAADEVERPSEGDDEEGEGADILLTPEQADQLLHQMIASKFPVSDEGKHRQKRKIDSNEFVRWSLPIVYKFDGNHIDTEKAQIREAIREWQTRTCIRFHETSTDDEINYAHIMFTREYGCYSFVGKLDLKRGNPQQINLGPRCLSQLGVPIHEIGHVLGLWHEHQRPNRDRFLEIVNRNIGTWARGNFIRRLDDKIEDYGVPYDFNSVMHYSSKVASINGDFTIKTRDPLYQKNLGQRVELSFLDAKVVNMAYCQGYCKPFPSLSCQNGGYPNPNDCYRCACPDGLTGKYCEQPLPSVGGYCSDTLELRAGQKVTLTTPEYDNSGTYSDGTRCNWLVKAQGGSSLYATFVEEFGVFQSGDKCYHWVEVKTKRDFSEPGYRFCGGQAPETQLASEGQQLMVMFRSIVPSYRGSYKRGFQLKIIAVREGEEPPRSWAINPEVTTQVFPNKPSTTGLTTRRTTTPTTTRPTTRRTTTTTTTPATTTTTTPLPYTGKVRISWSAWSLCQGHPCTCGAYSVRKRLRLCNNEICKGALYKEENLSCDRLCTPNDLETIYVGKFYQRPCKACTRGFIQNSNERCVPA